MKRPGKGAHGKEVEKYAHSLGWSPITTNGNHLIWTKDGKRIAISKSARQPLGIGTLMKTLKELES